MPDPGLTPGVEAVGADGPADPTLAVPDEVTSPSAKLVYLYLSTVTEAQVADIRAALDVDLLTLYPVLDTLMDRGLVGRQARTYRCLR